MKVDGLDIDVGVEGVLNEENRIMGRVEATCKNVMIDILGRLLQGNDMPPSCNLFFEGVFFSASASRVPVVDAESLLHKRTIRRFSEKTHHASFLTLHKSLRQLFEHQPYDVPRYREGLF